MKFSQFAKTIRTRFPTASLIRNKQHDFLCTEFIHDGLWVGVVFVDGDGDSEGLEDGWRVTMYPTTLVFAFKKFNHEFFETFEEAFQVQLANCYTNLDAITVTVIKEQTKLDKFMGADHAS